MKEKISKIIHCCWFGGKDIPDDVKKCMESWNKYMPDYKIMMWNESNFDLNQNRFALEAYNARKFAFVTDYVRLYVLNKYGGIYMDTDVEVVKNLDFFLQYGAFTSFENDVTVPTGMMAAEKGHNWIKELLDFYSDISFISEDGILYNQPNTVPITTITKSKYNINLNGKYQVLNDDIHIFPMEYFCAKDWRDGSLHITENTYTIHHFKGSWVPKKDKVYGMLRYKVKKILEKLSLKEK